MFLIRENQIHAFEAAAVLEVEDDLERHVRTYFPGRHRVAGEAAVREAIRLAMERAAAYGISAWRDVCTYLDCMLLLGSRFDDDPQLPWAKRLLERSAAGGPHERVLRLAEDTLSYLDAIHEGDETRIAARALAWIRLGAPYDGDAMALLREISPEKVRLVGEPTLGRAMQGLAGGPAGAISLVLAFTLGAGWRDDLLVGLRRSPGCGAACGPTVEGPLEGDGTEGLCAGAERFFSLCIAAAAAGEA